MGKAGDEAFNAEQVRAIVLQRGWIFRSWPESPMIHDLGIMRGTMAPSFLVLVIGLWLLAGSAAAEPLYDTKVYNPETKSYFELVRNQRLDLSIRCRNCYELSWAAAMRLAHQRTFKGVRARLAVVKSRQVNEFLRKTFRPERAAWIGLRYLCRFNKLQWVTGEFHPHTGYANWDLIWNHSGSRNSDLGILGSAQCRKGVSEYWPVHYWGINHGFRWNANGTIKEFFEFFVEYPTGKR